MCSCANGNAQISRGQSRSVVDAITHHRHSPFLTELLQSLEFLLRKHLPTEVSFGEAQPLPEATYGHFTVTTEDGELETGGAEPLQ